MAVGALFALGKVAFQDDFSVNWGALVRAPAFYSVVGLGAVMGAVTTRESWAAAPTPPVPLATENRVRPLAVVRITF